MLFSVHASQPLTGLSKKWRI